MNRFKRFAKKWTPPALIGICRSLSKKGVRFVGHYSSWAAAMGVSTGYNAEIILERVSAALTKVKSGSAVYERDSVLFDEVTHSFPLLAVLTKAALQRGGALTVLDFGGSLGSSYFQCKNFLPDNLDLKWCVVEQEGFVRRGHEAFTTDVLKFYLSIEECVAQYKPDIVLFASVLQYLENVDQILDETMATGAEYVVIDRTPFTTLEDDWICVQHVPSEIYEASYPCAILSESHIRQRLDQTFKLVATFEALGGQGQIQCKLQQIPFEYRGMIWQKSTD